MAIGSDQGASPRRATIDAMLSALVATVAGSMVQVRRMASPSSPNAKSPNVGWSAIVPPSLACAVHCGCLVHRDVRLAAGRERGSGPVRPAILQPQPRDARHQVQLRRPGVAELYGEHLDARLPDEQMARVYALLVNVELRHVEEDRVAMDIRRNLLAAGQPRDVGDERLDNEYASLVQVPGHRLEATRLCVLVRQREERGEHDEDEVVPSVEREVGEVADPHGDVRPARLPPELGDHRLRRVHPMDFDAERGQRQRDQSRPVPMPSSSARPFPASRASVSATPPGCGRWACISSYRAAMRSYRAAMRSL